MPVDPIQIGDFRIIKRLGALALTLTFTSHASSAEDPLSRRAPVRFGVGAFHRST